jgi:hypothetical protein
MTPLTIQEHEEPVGIVSDRALYLKADQYTLVEQGDTTAAYGLVQAGGLISAEDAHRLHLQVKNGRVEQMSREEAYKASGQEAPAPAEKPKAELLVRPKAPPPPPPPPPMGNTSQTPQSPPTPPAAVPAGAKPGEKITVEEKKRLADRAESMGSGDMTTPAPKEGEPLRAAPDTDTAKGSKRGSKRATKSATKRGKSR